jgi:NADH-quinone oxidoreductase subunit M
MSEFGGIARSMPIYATMFALAVFASVGLPGLNGFVGEYLTLIGAFISTHLSTTWFAVIAASGVILAAVYLLILYQGIFFGPLDKSENARLKDLKPVEIGMMVPLVIFFIWIGFYPSTFLGVTESSTRAVVGVIEKMQGQTRYAEEANLRLYDSSAAPTGASQAPADTVQQGPVLNPGTPPR